MIRIRCGLVALAAISIGCASVPTPREALADASSAIARAQKEDAGQHAPLELRKAQDKFAAAERAAAKERNLEARRSAEQAQVDAELATAKAERAQAGVAATALERTVQALEREIEHERQ